MGIVYGYRLQGENQGGIEAWVQASLGHLQWGGCFVDPAISKTIPFSKRQAGKQLYDRAVKGDHVVFDSIGTAFSDAEDCAQVNRLWLNMEIQPHYLNCGMMANDPLFKQLLIEKCLLPGRKRKYTKSGSHVGMVPLGFVESKCVEKGVVKRNLRLDYAAVKVAGYIIDMRAGGWSFGRIADILNERGLKKPSKGGPRWCQQYTRKFYEFGIKNKIPRNPAWQQLPITSQLGTSPRRKARNDSSNGTQ